MRSLSLRSRFLTVFVFVLLVPVCVVRAHEPVLNSPPPGFQALFNGKDLSGWWGCGTENPAKWMALSEQDLAAKKTKSLEDIRAHWSVKDGELINDGHGLYLTTEKNYGDFELLLEYRTVAKADSGVYLRGIPQVQIWDTTKEGGKWNIGADKGSGGLWNNSPETEGKDPLVFADHAFGDWNHFRILMVGERVTIFFNGQLVVNHARLENYFDRKNPVPRKGPVQLQTHGGEIRWRNVHLREIGGEEANTWLALHSADGFVTALNGRDFSGWKGPIDNYEIKNGILKCRTGKGGTIFTEEEYTDFMVRLEVRFPPGGNNGLAIRYPGDGDTAYVGMCELQILENTHPKYANLDSRQYHGSVYGQVAAARGYQRPVGEWNFQEITVQGSRIRVELNGFRIVDADISEVTEFMYEAEKFSGRTRTQGHFGFAGHNDPVEFRQVRIKALDSARQ